MNNQHRPSRGTLPNGIAPRRSPAGTLYLVSTPIGNLEDITLRALRVLKEVDLIACENTRITIRLLQHYQIKKPLLSYFEHNKIQRTRQLVEALAQGKRIVLVSNAGTPLISDPGYELVQECIKREIPIIPIPGASALIASLSIAGLPTDRFVFEGFLPIKTSKRKRRWAALQNEPRTIVLYEAPHRLLKTLQEILKYLGDREIALVKELTKYYEEIKRGEITEIIQSLTNQKIRGEFTIVVAGNELNHKAKITEKPRD